MTIGSLFSGIGGLELGLERAGLGPVVWQVEQNAFCRGVLAKHWPNVERYDDVRTVGVSTLAPATIICGGFPCQDVSNAGKGAGLEGARSGLWREFARIVGELHPGACVVENVASGARRWLPFVRRDLHLLGYRTRALALSAADVGAPHLRRRVFVLAADPERFELREQSGRSEGSGEWTGSSEPANDGASWVASDRDGVRELQPSGSVEEFWRWSRDGDMRWTIESAVPGVAYGVPRRVDRERALGNAVVPQCAEVAGRVLLDWARVADGRAA